MRRSDTMAVSWSEVVLQGVPSWSCCWTHPVSGFARHPYRDLTLDSSPGRGITTTSTYMIESKSYCISRETMLGNRCIAKFGDCPDSSTCSVQRTTRSVWVGSLVMSEGANTHGLSGSAGGSCVLAVQGQPGLEPGKNRPGCP